MTAHRRGLFVIACAAASSASQAQLLVSAVSASTDMGSGFGTQLINTINGNGLSSLSLTATHAGTIPSNSWVSLGSGPGQVTFDLGGTFSINGFSFWNQNGGGPGAGGSAGIQNVTVLRSTDGINFVPIPGAPTVFAQQPGTANVAPEIFAFAAVSASHIRFQIASNWGFAQTGFAEVQFSAVPAPAAAMVLAAGLLFRRRRLC
jgi:hypothetical protein